ncbi:MAG: MATE family efflux transporter [Firmicutes bacterium]|nr:MATE family efflux transporter [Bacillota bacterium]
MKLSSSKPDMAAGSIGKLLLRLSIPAITAQLVNVLYNIVDRIYIGHIPVVGTDALTGVGVTFPILTLISAFSFFVGSGGAPQAAINMGKGNKDEAERILGNCFTMLVSISIVLTALILALQRPMLMAFGASESTIDYAVDYLTLYTCGTIFIQLVLGLNPFISCQGFASVAMKTTLIGALLNIVLDPVFIFLFGLGVKGAAVATVISQAISCVWVLKFLTGNKSQLKIRKQYLIPNKKIVFSVLALGISPFIMQSTESILFVSFNSSLQTYGQDIAVGSMTILSSLMQFALLPVLGLCQGGQPIISYNYGARNNDRVKKAFYLILISCFTYTTILTAAIFLNSKMFVSLFTDNKELIEFASWAVKIYMAGTFFFGIQIACQQTFIALNEAKLSLFLAIFRKIILLIPLIYMLPALLPESVGMMFIPEGFAALVTHPAKVFSVFFAEPVSDIIAVAATATLFALNFNKILMRER